MRTEHFQRVNGYSNLYWGWGAEDDDMAYRFGKLSRTKFILMKLIIKSFSLISANQKS